MPADAYRFAKGEEVTGASGQKAKLSRPLDFLAVTDHSDQMGLVTDLIAGKPEIIANPTAKHWYDMMQAGKDGDAAKEIVTMFAQGKFPKEIMYNPGSPGYRATWDLIIKAAEEANEPGKFTAFIAYEWTSLVTRQQSAPQRPLSRERRQGQPGRAVHQLSAGQLQSA